MPVIRYTFASINWPEYDLKEVQDTTVRLLKRNKHMDKKTSIAWLYRKRKEWDRGRKHAKSAYVEETVGFYEYLETQVLGPECRNTHIKKILARPILSEDVNSNRLSNFRLLERKVDTYVEAVGNMGHTTGNNLEKVKGHLLQEFVKELDGKPERGKYQRLCNE